MNVNHSSLIHIGTFQSANEPSLREVINASFEIGIYSFDTAPSYKTESILGQILAEKCAQYKIERSSLYISDKLDDIQMEESKGNIEPFVNIALQELRVDYIDTLFIHWPFEAYLFKSWEKLGELKNKNKIKEIGLCNVRVRHLKKIIKETGIKPDVIQIERHPLRTCDEELSYCRVNNISVQAYSPLCRMSHKITNNQILKRIACTYGKSIPQIILRWHLDTGVVPVFTTHKIERIKDNCDIFDFRLSDQDIKDINSLNENYKIFLESYCCPGF